MKPPAQAGARPLVDHLRQLATERAQATDVQGVADETLETLIHTCNDDPDLLLDALGQRPRPLWLRAVVGDPRFP